VCLDSCHLLASGYDIRTPAGMSAVLREATRKLGRGMVRSLHLNDSQTPLGSNRDRHANIGTGELGEDGCSAFLSAPGVQRVPCVLETPGTDHKGPPREEVLFAMELRERGLAARRRR
jgi:deoxyribonuclease-4